ncbi:MAG TPA: M64 family metallopeptidase [Burkholderiales bacterium]|nr:M64 family metallopeptidase [Burkholderiales bacterium]
MAADPHRTISPDRRDVLKRVGAAALSLLTPACGPDRSAPYSRGPEAFDEGALRIALRHQLVNSVETFTLLALRKEDRWAGLRIQEEHTPDWGDYRLSVHDAREGTLLYRAGFDSNLDSALRSATTDLSVRLPLPKRRVKATIEKRRADMLFLDVWSVDIDPGSSDIDRTPRAIATRVDSIVANGPPHSKLDIAILGDGYREDEHAKFLADARRATGYLFSVEPFKKRIGDFNINALFAPSLESGVTDRYLALDRKTVFRVAYGTGQAERTLSAHDEQAVREAACAAPYDFLLVLANARRYGGSAYFGGPAVVAIDNAAARYLVLHEFAHAISGLAEEYYIPADDGPKYAGNVEPWNPNVTTTADKAKWRAASPDPLQHLSWNKQEYERYFRSYVARYFGLRNKRVGERIVEKFMHAESERQAALLAKTAEPRRVGLFEGANGYAKGMFRSEIDCIMFSLQTRHFCRACEMAIEQTIDAHCR